MPMNISMLLYGKAGSGKSIFASTFPKALIFDADRSHKLYEKAFPQHKVLNENLIFYLQGAIQQIEAGTFKYDTIIIDSLTALENDAVSSFKGLTDKNWDRSLYSKHVKKLGYDEWGNVSGSTIALLTRLRQLPVNFVIITQVETMKTENGLKFRPSLVGKGSDEALHFPDFVGYMETIEGKNGVERYLNLSSTISDDFIAKARHVGGDIPKIKNPNYEKLVKIIEEDSINLNFED